MTILFSVSSFGFLRNFQSTVRLLAERGHRIHLLAERGDTVDGQKMADALVAEHPDRITAGMLPSSRHRLWYALGTGLRAALDYWRYLDPRWDGSPKLRARAAGLAPAFARALPRVPLIGTPAGLSAVAALFRAIDRRLPPSVEVADVFDRVKPDLLLLTPLLYFRSHQVDHVRCARLRGVKSVVGIGSWDHLTTKGLIHEVPDRVLVWNEAQKQEAVELHGVKPDRVLVTGAQAYDHWFSMTPSADRASFCARVGLDPARPVLLYLCSSSFIAPQEVGFVRQWIAAVRTSRDERLRSAGLLVRPHPQNAEQWRDADPGAWSDNVAVYPRAGVNPIGGEARADYFDSMYHAEAVVGVNTSAMIESGIVGRPVFAVQAEEFAATQDGTLHFQHLKNIEGGLLHLSRTLDEHVAQLEQMLADPEAARRRARGFIQAFVRPHGLDAPATPRLVGELEAFAAGPAPVPQQMPGGSRVVRAMLAVPALLLTLLANDPARRRTIVKGWVRPVRLAGRAFRARAVYTWRFFRRVPRQSLRFLTRLAKVTISRPARWAIRRAQLAAPAPRRDVDVRLRGPIHVLFSMRHLGSLRMYESVLRALAGRGHTVDIVAERRDIPGASAAPETVLAGVPGIQWVWEEARVTRWTGLAAAIRIWLDYLRFREPRYRATPRLAERVAERVPPALLRISTWGPFRTEPGRRALVRVLKMAERALPRRPELDALVRGCRPDVVLVTPLLRLGSSQVEVLRSAKACGARTAVCVASWDHLSSKGRIAELPDRVFVWNETQKQEAVELHGVPADRITVTGAQCYDEWFDRRPARSREAFCAAVGLPADRPLLLYVCSAFSPATPVEARFVRRWIEGVRSSADPILRSAAILVRPHPQRHDEWREVDLSGLSDVALHGSHPLDEESKADYFDSLYHSAAVVGLLTSAFLEAAVVGRPVHVFVPPEFEERQLGLVHFHYLQSVGGGLFRATKDFDVHLREVAASLRRPARPDGNAAFVEAFIRPRGLHRPATGVFVDEVEAFARTPAPAPAGQPIWAPLVRPLLLPAAWLVDRVLAGSADPSDRTMQQVQQARRRDAHRRQKEAEERRLRAERDAERQARARRAEAARQAEMAARQARLDESELQKRERKAERERQKRRRSREKRRAAIVASIKRRLGVH